MINDDAIVTCKKCVLSSNDDKAIVYDKNGICNYCNGYDLTIAGLGSFESRKNNLEKKIAEIKGSRGNKKYDCVLGVSGGVDSTYLAYWAVQNGLRPLVVHFDNGWNSELAVKNIENICTKLNLELQTIVIDWEEFKQLQLAYLKAGVVDIEVITDHAIFSTILEIAKRYKIKYTLNGFNYATEAIMPKGWTFDKSDFTNIKDINSKFGTGKIKSYPHLSFVKKLWYKIFLKLESFQVLNYMDYNKESAKKLITEKLGWRDYGGKHYESVFTKFYQAYILPKKFGIDKRRAHLSTLICSGQIDKASAIEELKVPLYNETDLAVEKAYVLKKLGLSSEEFESIMQGPIRLHKDFETQEKLWSIYFRFIDILKFRKRK